MRLAEIIKSTGKPTPLNLVDLLPLQADRGELGVRLATQLPRTSRQFLEGRRQKRILEDSGAEGRNFGPESRGEQTVGSERVGRGPVRVARVFLAGHVRAEDGLGLAGADSS